MIDPAGGSRLRRRLLLGAALVVAVNLAVLGGAAMNRTAVVSGPAGSSYVTTPSGTAAWFELLAARGVDVRRLRRPIGADSLGRAATYVVVDADLSSFAEEERAALAAFVRAGGTVVVVGAAPTALYSALIGGDPAWRPGGVGTATAWAPLPGGARALAASRFGSFTGPGATLPLFGAGDRTVGALAAVGAGRVYLIADSGIVANSGIGSADNALLAVGLGGGGPVVFDEYRHGYASGDTLGFLPPAWRRTLPLLALAVCVVLVGYARRLGPPEEDTGHGAPERLRYVEALAGILRRSGDGVAVAEPVRAAARRAVAERASLPHEAGTAQLREAATRMGLTPTQVDAIMAADGDPVAAAAAFTTLRAGKEPT